MHAQLLLYLDFIKNAVHRSETLASLLLTVISSALTIVLRVAYKTPKKIKKIGILYL